MNEVKLDNPERMDNGVKLVDQVNLDPLDQLVLLGNVDLQALQDLQVPLDHKESEDWLELQDLQESVVSGGQLAHQDNLDKQDSQVHEEKGVLLDHLALLAHRV